MTTEEPKLGTAKLTYVGRRETHKGIRPFYLREGAEEAQGFMKPLRPGVPVGGILECTYEEPNVTAFHTKGPHAPRLVGRTEHGPQLLGWDLEDRAAAQIEAARQRETKLAGKPSELDSYVAALRMHMSRMTRQERAVTLGWIIDRLVN